MFVWKKVFICKVIKAVRWIKQSKNIKRKWRRSRKWHENKNLSQSYPTIPRMPLAKPWTTNLQFSIKDGETLFSVLLQVLCPGWVCVWIARGSRRSWWLPVVSRPLWGPWWRPWGRWSWVRAWLEPEVGASSTYWPGNLSSDRRWWRSSTTLRWGTDR